MKKGLKILLAAALSSREHINNLVEIINLIKPNKPKLNDAVIASVNILTKYLKEDNLSFSDSQDPKDSDALYCQWLWDQHSNCFDAMLNCLVDTENSILLLENILTLLQLKGFCMNKNSDKFLFPEDLLEKTVHSCLSSNELSEHLTRLLPLDDFRFYILKVIPKVINSEHYTVEKVYSFLKSIVDYMPTTDSEMNSSFIFSESDVVSLQKYAKSPPFSVAQHRKRFASAWLEFLKQPLPGSIHKNVLIIFHTSLVPHFAKPRLLADFLTRSYAKGGGLALLALHGLFVLMHQHNLEYPEFYRHVYSMLHPRIFDARYKARFFYLLDLFLASTHVPSYLVAAFAKKMSRLCLIAPPDCARLMVALVLNLTRRHPSVRQLVHRAPAECQQVAEDPFVESEPDPARTRALESSLWEIATLKRHYSPDVVKSVSFKGVGSLETDIGALLDSDCATLFDQSCSTDFKECPASHVTPDRLFGGFEDVTTELWCT